MDINHETNVITFELGTTKDSRIFAHIDDIDGLHYFGPNTSSLVYIGHKIFDVKLSLESATQLLRLLHSRFQQELLKEDDTESVAFS